LPASSAYQSHEASQLYLNALYGLDSTQLRFEENIRSNGLVSSSSLMTQHAIVRYIRYQTLGQGKLWCLNVWNQDNDVETLVNAHCICTRNDGKEIALAREVQAHGAFLKLLTIMNQKPCSGSLSKLSKYSYVMYAERRGHQDKPAPMFEFECRVVHHAENITVESAMDMILNTQTPICFIGIPELRRPDGPLTLSLVDWGHDKYHDI
jgi:hypothetical protein